MRYLSIYILNIKESDLNNKVKYSLIVIIGIFIVLQFIPVDRDNPANNEKLELKAPPEVAEILEKSCYDCHSNRTNWPFYSYIAPISWLVAHDVEEGRDELNFSEWNNISSEKRDKIIEEIIEEVNEDEMPLKIYLLMHPESQLDDQQKAIIRSWSEPDSLQ
jgi:hypothetical protein